jgi:hypothetical protein
LAAISVFGQKGSAAVVTGPAVAQKAAQTAKPEVLGSLRTASCIGYPSKPCRGYLVEAFDYHWEYKPPTELRVTDLDQNKVVFVDRDVNYLLYMFPLDSWGNLLATVWGTGSGNRGVKIYRLDQDSVKVVFYNGSRFTPQFIEGNSTVSPVVILDQGYVMRGNAILPTETQMWQWDPGAGKFQRRLTVPIERKFAALAELLGGSR